MRKKYAPSARVMTLLRSAVRVPLDLVPDDSTNGRREREWLSKVAFSS